jgi:anti-sigma regulatory factor (Ser/Thr protein kinase)
MAREALANAIEHGSRFDAAKKVSFSLATRGDVLVCRVADEGPGFPGGRPPAGARAALEGDEAPIERGTGIMIMEEYSDRLYFEDGGRTVVFERRIEKGKAT